MNILKKYKRKRKNKQRRKRIKNNSRKKEKEKRDGPTPLLVRYRRRVTVVPLWAAFWVWLSRLWERAIPISRPGREALPPAHPSRCMGLARLFPRELSACRQRLRSIATVGFLSFVFIAVSFFFVFVFVCFFFLYYFSLFPVSFSFFFFSVFFILFRYYLKCSFLSVTFKFN